MDYRLDVTENHDGEISCVNRQFWTKSRLQFSYETETFELKVALTEHGCAYAILTFVEMKLPEG